MNINKELLQFETVSIKDSPKIDLTPFQQYVRTITNVAKLQQKSYQEVSYSFNEILKKIENYDEIIKQLNQQKTEVREQHLQLVQFALDEFDLIENFLEIAMKSGRAELLESAKTLQNTTLMHLSKIGITVINVHNEIPDPIYHFVVGKKECDNSELLGRVIEIVKQGLSYNGKVIRKAEVVIAK